MRVCSILRKRVSNFPFQLKLLAQIRCRTFEFQYFWDCFESVQEKRMTDEQRCSWPKKDYWTETGLLDQIRVILPKKNNKKWAISPKKMKTNTCIFLLRKCLTILTQISSISIISKNEFSTTLAKCYESNMNCLQWFHSRRSGLDFYSLCTKN